MSVNVGTAERGLSDIIRPDAIAWIGVALGALAFWLALPPVAARSALIPLVVGGLGVAAGLWALRMGANRRLAFGAVAAAVLGALLGWLATRSGVQALDSVFV